MKCTIILLALCAFETVFAAAFVMDLNSLHQKYTIKLKAVLVSFNIFVTNAIRVPKVMQCKAEYKVMERYHQDGMTQCSECYRKALIEHMNIEVAEQCYYAIFEALQNKSFSRRHAVHTCISNILAGHPFNPKPAPALWAKPPSPNQSKTE